MHCTAVIFDMDGLLINSEPLWAKAANQVFAHYGAHLTDEQHEKTTGLRTAEFVDYWFKHYAINPAYAELVVEEITHTIISAIRHQGDLMPGAIHALRLCKELGYRIGLASSSPQEVIDTVMQLFHLERFIEVTASAGQLNHGKPHPEVYLNCAARLETPPLQCIAFEDSFNGMIAAKAARMKCVVVPAHHQQKDKVWGAAELQLTSLQNLTALHIQGW